MTGMMRVAIALGVATMATAAAEAGGWHEGHHLVRPDVAATQPAPFDVVLASNDAVADIYVAREDATVVHIAARLLADDIEKTSGRRPAITHDAAALGRTAVLIGTLGTSPLIDDVVVKSAIDTGRIRRRWEAFGIQTVQQPIGGVDRALLIIGNDRRGTAYGVMELCGAIGVSPWHYWADVPTPKRRSVVAGSESLVTSAPSVQYRGIFINDEWLTMLPWVANTLDPQTKLRPGPALYTKVFELMLRLRLNLLWPPAWKREFGEIPGNFALADEWGIIIGSSHCEAMLRSNHVCIDRRPELTPWRYDTNRDHILAYWEESARDRGAFEAVWTVGMRGGADTPFEGPDSPEGKARLMEQVVADQRGLLETHVRPHRAAIPQCFMPYTDVLEIYDAGLQLPDDVTIVWPEDNWGNIRRLPTAAERQRSGGHGIYYHVDYFGPPEQYTWFSTTPPARIWVEMRKAWDNGVRRLWVLNVGEIKSQEVCTDFWARLAWNIDAFGPDSQPAYLEALAAEWFGTEPAPDVAAVWGEFFRLCCIRKPEHLHDVRWIAELGPEMRSTLLDSYQSLADRLDACRKRIAPELQDAFFATVYYPVRMLCAAGLMSLHRDRSFREAATPAVAQTSAAEADRWQACIDEETKAFNTTLAGGKWRHMMVVAMNCHPSCPEPQAVLMGKKPWDKYVFDRCAIGPAARPLVATFAGGDHAGTKETPDATWRTITGLGWTGRAVALVPMVEAHHWDLAQDVDAVPHLDYRFEMTTDRQDLVSLVHVLPSFRLHPGLDLRVAVSVDGGPPQVQEVPHSVPAKGWDDQMGPRRDAVRNNRTTLSFPLPGIAAGPHTLRLWTPSPGVIVDQIDVVERH
jgi:hypothetical protein